MVMYSHHMTQNTQWQEGWDAFFALADKDENPYLNTDEVSAFDWEKGWQDAAKESDTWNYSN